MTNSLLAPASVHSLETIPGNACRFLSLPHELVIEILKYLPVPQILQIETTCKALFRLCRSRVLWLSYLFSADIEHTPNIPPSVPLSSLSTDELRKRIVFAQILHKTWTTPGLSHDLLVGGIDIPQTIEDVNNFVKPQMLPGRTEVLAISEGRLGLWAMEDGQCLWKVEPFNPQTCCLGFSFELLYEGTILIVATIEVDRINMTGELSTMDHLRVFSFDLTTRESELLFQCELHDVYEASMTLQGDYIQFPVQVEGMLGTQILVLNWKESCYQQFSFVDTKGLPRRSASTALVKNHLVSFTNIENVGFSAFKIHLSSYEDQMSYDMDHVGHSDPIVLCPTSNTSKERGVTILPLPCPPRETHYPSFRLGINAFTPTWAPNMPTQILAVFMDEAPERPAHLITYHLRLYNDDPSHHLRLVQWNDRPTLRIPWNFNSLSNSGHMFELTKDLFCFSLISSSTSDTYSQTQFPIGVNEEEFLNPRLTQPMNELEMRPSILPEFNPREILRTSVEPWSGCIMCLSDEKLWVLLPTPRPSDDIQEEMRNQAQQEMMDETAAMG